MGSDPLSRTAARLSALRQFITNLVWLVVVVIVLGAVGKLLLDRQALDRPDAPRTVIAVPDPIPWHEVDAAVAEAFAAARTDAETYSSAALDGWIAGLVERVDADFLDWYFDYWNQQVLGLQSLWYASVHTVLEEQPTATEKITENIQAEFAQRVLRPEVAQLELENIVRDVMQRYVRALYDGLSDVPARYDIPEADWERYLDDISLIAEGTDAGRSVPLTAKTVYVVGAGGALAVGMQASQIAAKVGGKVASKTAGKAAAQMATKTGAKVAAKSGGKLLGPIIGIGIIVWDVWDHNQTRTQNRPILRETLVDYFAEMKDSILHDPEAGIMSGIHRIEASMVESLSD